MTRDLKEAEKVQLEALVDATSLGAVLEALSTICGEKADHIAASYGDKWLTKAWNTASGFIGCHAVDKIITALEHGRK